MQRKSFGNMQCPVARSLDRVGEWWSILILRDAFVGMTRFDEFQKSLNIAPNILTRRLVALVEAGMLERRLYCDRPPRYEYVLTERGRDFRPVLISLQTWGNRHFAPEGLSVMLVDARTGVAAEPMLVDRLTGQPITEATHKNTAGPAAGARVKKRLDAAHEAAGKKSSQEKPRRTGAATATNKARSTRRTLPDPKS
jgi:DNA-binding HxlR family transcriptional regulator